MGFFMELKVLNKQNNSRMCIVCGFKNDLSLQAEFYELEDKSLCALVTFKDAHQGYPSRVHGGILAAILDETIGRAMMPYTGEDKWGVTMTLTTKYKKPVPINEEIRIIGKITSGDGRIFEGEGYILLNDDKVAVTAKGTYICMSLEKIAEMDPNNEEDWALEKKETDPKIINIP